MAGGDNQSRDGASRRTPSVGRRRLVSVGGAAVVLGLTGCTAPADNTRERNDAASPTETDDDHAEGEHDGEEHDSEEHDDEEDDHGEESHDSVDEDHDAEHTHDEVPEEPADQVEVVMKTTDDGEAHFDPHVAWVTPGGSVTFRLESGNHTTTAYALSNGNHRRIPEAAPGWDSGLLETAGETYQLSFETEGVYDYYCRPHEGSGMVGTVLVGEPDLHHQPGMTSPNEDVPPAAREKIVDLNETVEEALTTHDQ